MADLKGPGVVNRIWTPTPEADTVKFYFDGEKTPRISLPFIDLLAESSTRLWLRLAVTSLAVIIVTCPYRTKNR